MCRIRVSEDVRSDSCVYSGFCHRLYDVSTKSFSWIWCRLMMSVRGSLPLCSIFLVQLFHLRYLHFQTIFEHLRQRNRTVFEILAVPNVYFNQTRYPHLWCAGSAPAGYASFLWLLELVCSTNQYPRPILLCKETTISRSFFLGAILLFLLKGHFVLLMVFLQITDILSC